VNWLQNYSPTLTCSKKQFDPLKGGRLAVWGDRNL
jgi:hypothetical protein